MKHKKWLYVALASVLCLSMVGFAACGDDKKDDDKPNNNDDNNNDGPSTQQSLIPTEAYSFPTSANTSKKVAVHDPSVFYDEASQMYYAFGSHYAVASSPDLIEWTQEVNDQEWSKPAQKNSEWKLYDEADAITVSGVKWPKALESTLDIVKPTANGNDTINTTWAPDVNFHDGKYYMYYSITKKFGSNESVIGRVVSDQVSGPYSDNEVILSSVGLSGNHVNCIDPELFTDKDGGLWMVYGSHFAGVYIVELNNSGANWGLPKEEGDMGKLLWKGGGKVVEGPFVFYNELTKYYYLMTTYGDLKSDYNMRIARSENPDGPYKDITGADMATISADGSKYGNKVAGSYEFAGQSGAAYAALGHNSVVKDADGRYFVICHVRNQTGTTVTGGHSLRVSQLFFNEEGWPVMSPVAYNGEKAGLISQAEAAGDYDIVVHSTGTTIDLKESTAYTLAADGTVTQDGTAAGSWVVKQNYYVEITIASVTYKGVIVPGWNMYLRTSNQTPCFAITAISQLSDQGGSLWGISAREA